MTRNSAMPPATRISGSFDVTLFAQASGDAAREAMPARMPIHKTFHGELHRSNAAKLH